MATRWIITPVQKKPSPENGELADLDVEKQELDKLAKGATEAARASMKLIDSQKAHACRKQMLQEMLTAK